MDPWRKATATVSVQLKSMAFHIQQSGATRLQIEQLILPFGAGVPRLERKVLVNGILSIGLLFLQILASEQLQPALGTC
jgi:hypothetical protein